MIKMYGGPHARSGTLRAKMVQLTNATTEFAILLHVSSLPTPSNNGSTSQTPSQTRLYSPMATPASTSASAAQTSFLGQQTSFLGLPEENRLGSSLSRSRTLRSWRPVNPLFYQRVVKRASCCWRRYARLHNIPASWSSSS